MDVYILTFCRDLEAFYGTALIFKTLRVGFPNAKIHVFDNASLPVAQSWVENLCQENECEFKKIPDPGIQHHEFIEETIRRQALSGTGNGPLIFLDPDICLWRSCEDFSFDGIVAGKKVRKFKDMIYDAVTMPRIHTSFLWVKDASVLLQKILMLKALRFDFEPFQPFSFRMDGVWYRYDTAASLYSVLPGEFSFFTEQHFDCYDHLFAGSHLGWIVRSYDDECRELLTRTHQLAKTSDIKALKGIWQQQDRIFNKSFPFVN